MSRITRPLVIIGVSFLAVISAAGTMTPLTSAQDSSSILLNPLLVRAIVYDNGSTAIRYEGTAHNTGLTPLDSFSMRIDSLDVVVLSSTVASGAEAATDVTVLERYSEVHIGLPTDLAPGAAVDFHLVVVAQDIQSEASLSPDGLVEERSMIFYLRPQSPVQNLTFTVVLPAHATLSRTAASPLFPSPDGNSTDGVSLIFVWSLSSLAPGQEQVFIVKYEFPVSLGANGGQSLTFSPLAAGVIGLVAGAVLMFLVPRAWRVFVERRRVKLVGITDEEREILEIVERKGGSCPQKELYEVMNVSQAKISLLLKGLESRGLIRRLREGRENIVYLLEE